MDTWAEAERDWNTMRDLRQTIMDHVIEKREAM